MKVAGIIFMVGAMLWQGCSSDDEVTPYGDIRFSLGYSVDAQSLVYDTLVYFNDAGNPYSVYRLEYFLSGISLVRADSVSVSIRDYQYVNAADPATNTIIVPEAPSGNYIGVRFNIGVDAAHNTTGGLPNNTANNNMEWPVPMGGGYHFMKFEGHYLSDDTLFGFNMHLGMNPHLVEVEIFTPITIGSDTKELSLVMNLNEWFRNPITYNFNTDGNYTMGDSLAMHKLSMNGADVFTLN